MEKRNKAILEKIGTILLEELIAGKTPNGMPNSLAIKGDNIVLTGDVYSEASLERLGVISNMLENAGIKHKFSSEKLDIKHSDVRQSDAAPSFEPWFSDLGTSGIMGYPEPDVWQAKFMIDGQQPKLGDKLKTVVAEVKENTVKASTDYKEAHGKHTKQGIIRDALDEVDKMFEGLASRKK